MTEKELNTLKQNIKELIDDGKYNIALNEINNTIDDLYANKEFNKICKIYDWDYLEENEDIYIFEVAFALQEMNRSDEAELIYSEILNMEPNNSAVLNNLSNILWEKGEYNKAWSLICKAFDLNQESKIIAKNYRERSDFIEERERIESDYKSATLKIPYENEYVISKLKCIIENSKKDINYKDGKIPIPKWKFKILMQASESIALSLAEQWCTKCYIRKTGDRGYHNEYIYEINPYLEKAIKEYKPLKLPQQWIEGLEKLDASILSELKYFSLKDRIAKIKKKYRKIIERDIDELYLNYLMRNKKAIVVISGSIVETLLIYYCEKKKITKIEYSIKGNTISKKLYKSDLGDLLNYFENKHILSNILVHLGNLARTYRNFIHPGKELRYSEELELSHSEICFISTLEIIKIICQRHS